MPLMTDEKYLTVEEVSQVLRLHPETVKELLRTEQIPGRKIGRKWRVSQEELDMYIRRKEDKK